MPIAVSDDQPLVHIRTPLVNRWLIIACVATYGLLPLDLPFYLFAFVPGDLLSPGGLPLADRAAAALTLISHQFIHLGLPHLIANMVALAVFGGNVEDALGHRRYLLFFLACGMVGALAEGWLSADPAVPLIGASGSISGVMAAYLVLHPGARLQLRLFSRLAIVIPAALLVGLDVLSNVGMAIHGGPELESTAWWAHLGGFGAGLILVLLLRRPGVRLFQIRRRPLPFPGRTGLFSGRNDRTRSPRTALGPDLAPPVPSLLQATSTAVILALVILSLG